MQTKSSPLHRLLPPAPPTAWLGCSVGFVTGREHVKQRQPHTCCQVATSCPSLSTRPAESSGRRLKLSFRQAALGFPRPSRMFRYACQLAMFCFTLSASSLCGCSEVLLVSLVLSCLVLSLRSACLFAYKASGSYVHFCPRPCLSTCRWARLATHRHWGPLCVSPVLSCPLWPCNRRMCVIAKETGQSPLAHTCSRTWVFLRRLHI